jgi:Kef-type K+ transport system membrane component KefB
VLSGSLSLFLFELAAIIFAAKLGGEACERYLKQPAVLGELAMGMIIGPYALGKLPIPGLGPLFPMAAQQAAQTMITPVSNEIYFIAQIAVIVLLFAAGLGTDFGDFFRFSGPASLIAFSGMVISFFLGASAAIGFGIGDSFSSPGALFTGAIVSATSTGITARILRDLGKLGTPEGTTTLAADVIDDVVGILVLTVILGITVGELYTSQVFISVGKSLGFWIALTAVGILAAKFISRFAISFKVVGAAVSIALALALFSGGLAERFGLATVIGAYSIGLALSNTKLASVLIRPIDTLHHVFVPIFFVIMGMMVNFQAMGSVIYFGLAISALAILGKLIGCGLPSLALGFNFRGATRIGFGMIPRGEVNLIIAGVGLTRGIISQDIFGIAVVIIMITIIVAPILLAVAYRGGGEGQRIKAAEGG